jgi:hypothetical protein
MVKNLIIQCPSCHQACELFLSSNAAIIVLNCPHCWTPIISNRTGVYVLPEKNMKSLYTGSSELDILKFLSSMSGKSEAPCPKLEKSVEQPKYTQYQACEFSKVATTLTTREEVISQDDITNLRIKLETCLDSKDFIEQI